MLRRGMSALDGRERLKGLRMALVSRPPELHRKEGRLAVGQTQMSGALSLWLRSLCVGRRTGAKRK